MLDLLLYAKGTKPSLDNKIYEGAKIFSTDSDYDNEDDAGTENEFIRNNNITIDGIKVFINDNDSDEETLPENILSFKREIIKIIKDDKPEVILLSKARLFKRVLHYSEDSEMKPKMTVTEDRTIIHYAMIGENNCAMLIAWDRLED